MAGRVFCLSGNGAQLFRPAGTVHRDPEDPGRFSHQRHTVRMGQYQFSAELCDHVHGGRVVY